MEILLQIPTGRLQTGQIPDSMILNRSACRTEAAVWPLPHPAAQKAESFLHTNKASPGVHAARRPLHYSKAWPALLVGGESSGSPQTNKQQILPGDSLVELIP